MKAEIEKPKKRNITLTMTEAQALAFVEYWGPLPPPAGSQIWEIYDALVDVVAYGKLK